MRAFEMKIMARCCARCCEKREDDVMVEPRRKCDRWSGVRKSSLGVCPSAVHLLIVSKK